MTRTLTRTLFTVLALMGLTGLAACVNGTTEGCDFTTDRACALEVTDLAMTLPDGVLPNFPDDSDLLDGFDLDLPEEESFLFEGDWTSPASTTFRSDETPFTAEGYGLSRWCGNALLYAAEHADQAATATCHKNLHQFSWGEKQDFGKAHYQQFEGFCMGYVSATYACQTPSF